MAGLRGRGGGAFPTASKWRAVATQQGPKVVVANGAEGEPASIKDRWLLRRRPELVLDGLELCAEAVGADRAYLVCCDNHALATVRESLAVRSRRIQTVICQLESSYAAGEETAVVQALNGGPAIPTSKPPRPFERGVGGLPTLVHNVETLARVSLLARAPRCQTALSLLVTVRAPQGETVLYETPPSLTVGDAIEATIGLTEVAGVVSGGYFSGLLGPRVLQLPLTEQRFRQAGSGLGCGAITILGSNDCPVQVAAWLQRFFEYASTGQCGSCINGTRSMSEVLTRLAKATASPEELARLARWSATLRGRGACALLDGAAQVAGSLLREFPAAVGAHIAGACLCEPWSPRPTDEEEI